MEKFSFEINLEITRHHVTSLLVSPPDPYTRHYTLPVVLLPVIRTNCTLLIAHVKGLRPTPVNGVLVTEYVNVLKEVYVKAFMRREFSTRDG